MAKQDAREIEPDRLGDIEHRVYAHAVRTLEFRLGDVCAAQGLAPKEARAAVERLLRMRLLRHAPGEPDAYAAVPPDSAEMLLLTPLIEDLAQRRQTIGDVREELARLVPLYEQGVTNRLRRHSVEVLAGPDTVREAIAALSAEATGEVLLSQPGGALPAEALRDSLDRAERVLARGVRVRALYQHTARFSRHTVGYVEYVTKRGAQVRTVGDGFMRALVFDRATALLPLQEGAPGAVVVREPNVVGFVADAFERAWTGASPFPTEYVREQVLAVSEDLKQIIARLLVDGHEDKVIARRLGMSQRTCQRHISEIMTRLGARNRLHAGYLLHRDGVSPRQEPSEEAAATRSDDLRPGPPGPW
ncbi:LuxR C-terminal-related transcriptional regulator [Streptomyces sp. NPDC053079]|uniref:LuxR C-terminal-related transcriptional regulator n=1 Tax=Streptomyces sp. NPDC053079 TaxID=3365697 RepID=UPI0037D445B6